MALGIKVKEKIARTIGSYFTTNEIVAVFKDKNIPTDTSLYAKWKITLDAFSKIPRDDALFHIICEFCHPLNFEDSATRQRFIEDLNTILAYEELKIAAKERTAEIVSTNIGGYITLANSDTKTSIDYVIEAINFFKNEYNKIRLAGLEYEYSLGENFERANGDLDDAEEHSGRLKAVEQLKNIGFIREFRIEERVENDGYYVWDYAICKIDERKMNQKEEPEATEAGAEALTQKVIHEHTHRFENSQQLEIVKMPELQIKGLEEGFASVGVEQKNAKYRFPHKLPRGTKWENFVFKFLDDDTMQVLVKGKKETIRYQDMGLEGKGGKPSVLWIFLRVLAKCSGEIAITDPGANTRYKKQKQGLSEVLESYFNLDFDPFHPYTTARAYKTRFVIAPPEKGFSFEKKTVTKEIPKEHNPFADIDDYMNEVAPTIAQTEMVPSEDER